MVTLITGNLAYCLMIQLLGITNLVNRKVRRRLLQLYVITYDENLGIPAHHKSFKKMSEAEQYMKDMNELNGVRAELKVKGVVNTCQSMS